MFIVIAALWISYSSKKAMIKIFREDTQWAFAGNVETAVLEKLLRQLPKKLQGDGSRVVTGNDGFAALLVFGDLSSETTYTLAKRLLATVTPVYLLDFDDEDEVTLKLDRRVYLLNFDDEDEAPVTPKLDHRKMRVTVTYVGERPSGFLKKHGIVTSTPVREVGIIEGVSVDEVKRALESEADDVELRDHSRGVLIDNAIIGGMVGEELGKRTYMIFYNPEDGHLSCILQEADQTVSSYSPQKPSPNFPPLDNVLGETTTEGILRVLEIPGELLGL